MRTVLLILVLAAQAWSQTYAVDPTPMSGSSPGWQGHTARFIVHGSRVVASGVGTRVTLQAGDDGFTAEAYIGHAPSVPVHPWDMEEPVPLSVAGEYTITCQPHSVVTCDVVPFSVVAGRDLVLSLAFSAGSASAVARDNAPDASAYSLYFKAGASEAGALAPDGYATGTPDRELVVSVEVTDPTTPPPAPRYRGALVWKQGSHQPVPPPTQLPAGHFTTVTFDTVVYDTAGCWDASRSRMVVPQEARFARLSAQVIFAHTGRLPAVAPNNLLRQIVIKQNYQTLSGWYDGRPGWAVGHLVGHTATTCDVQAIGPVIAVKPGDDFMVEAFQTEDIPIDIRATNGTWFAMEIIE